MDNFLVYSLFTAGVIFILLPLGVNLAFSSIRYMSEFGLEKYPENSDIKLFGSGPLESILVGMLALAFSAWYLFIDQGGHLLCYIERASLFFKGG